MTLLKYVDYLKAAKLLGDVGYMLSSLDRMAMNNIKLDMLPRVIHKYRTLITVKLFTNCSYYISKNVDAVSSTTRDEIVHQMDVKIAYLNAPIDCELYIEQPEGFVADDKTDGNLVLKLKKSLYGLKQSGRNWNNMLLDYLISEGFQQSSTEYCVYTRFNMDSKVIILFWDDDIIIAASNESVLKTVKQSMHSKFKMKDLGQLS